MRSIAGVDANLLQDRHQPQPRFRIPQDLPPSISRYIIPVTEPDDIITEFQSRRERNYHLLIRRFINQILYGCTNPACTTPTCLSYQKRTTKTPLRKLTPLSARTLACYLATESKPEAALCPHCPQVYAEHEPVHTVKRWPRRKSHNVTFESSEKGAADIVGNKVTQDDCLRNSDTDGSRQGVLVKSTWNASELEETKEPSRYQHVDELWEKDSPRNQSGERPACDPKSFTQTLFETLPLRMLGRLPFQPHPESESQTLNGSYWRVPDEISATKDSTTLRGTPGKRLDRSPPSKVSQTHLGQIPSHASAKDSEIDIQKLANGDARHVHKDIPRPRHTSRTSSLKIGMRWPIEATETPPSALSFPEKRRSSPRVELSPSLSAESRQDHVSNTISRKQIRTQSNHSHDHLLSQNDHPQSDIDHQPIRGHPVTSDEHLEATYTLERIPWTTFNELRLLQTKLEKQCFGYQLKDRRPLLDNAKPHESLTLRFSDWNAFLRQCCFYLLRDPSRLARAFQWDQTYEQITNATWFPILIQPVKAFEIFGALYSLRPAEEILQFLSYSLDHVFLSPLELTRPLRTQTRRDQARRRILSDKQSVDRNAPGLSDRQAAFTCAVILHALGRFTAIKHQCFFSPHANLCWNLFCRLRSFGRIMPADFIAVLEEEYEPACHFAHLKCLTDVFENEIALNLVSKLAKAVSNRATFTEVSNARMKQKALKKRQSVLQLLMQYLTNSINLNVLPSKSPTPPPLPSTILEWLRTVVLRDWDGQPIIRRAGAVGGALQMLATMYEHHSSLRLEPKTFQTPFFADRLDTMETPVEWLSYRPDNKSLHLLSHSFLFPPSTLVTYFRALNFATMSKSFETALITSKQVSQFARSEFVQLANEFELLTTLRPATATYLVLNVRRSQVVTDAMDQLWRRQKRELLRPLKVRMGMDEGEEGVDHGGVQQEFFRCLFAEALSPAYGMFTIDERTRMTWFQPRSLEPLYKYELLGLLFSIAVYNSITLPITFPLAFYRKLLDLPVKKLTHIQDGWPELAKGLGELLDWSEGDVGDIFLRTYDFSFDLFGKPTDVDMQRVSRDDPWPTPSPATQPTRKAPSDGTPPRSEIVDEAPAETEPGPSKPTHPSTPSPASTTSTTPHPEAPLVTNTNRAQYVKDYIFWLTHKSILPQYSAFATGFYTCLDRTALSLFTAEALQSFIQGSQHISIRELQSITKYEDGYTADTATIRYFWEVVQGFGEAEKRALLEFVTACERVPVNGLASLVFVIQRSGDDASRLPTSMTCFGRLLLPEYASPEVLAEKLRKAIENSRGFGVA